MGSENNSLKRRLQQLLGQLQGNSNNRRSARRSPFSHLETLEPRVVFDACNAYISVPGPTDDGRPVNRDTERPDDEPGGKDPANRPCGCPPTANNGHGSNDDSGSNNNFPAGPEELYQPRDPFATGRPNVPASTETSELLAPPWDNGGGGSKAPGTDSASPVPLRTRPDFSRYSPEILYSSNAIRSPRGPEVTIHTSLSSIGYVYQRKEGENVVAYQPTHIGLGGSGGDPLPLASFPGFGGGIVSAPGSVGDALAFTFDFAGIALSEGTHRYGTTMTVKQYVEDPPSSKNYVMHFVAGRDPNANYFLGGGHELSTHFRANVFVVDWTQYPAGAGHNIKGNSRVVVQEDPDAGITYIDDQGNTIFYPLSLDEKSYDMAADDLAAAKLSISKDGGGNVIAVLRTTKYGEEEKFSKIGDKFRIDYSKDSYGNQLTFEYDSAKASGQSPTKIHTPGDVVYEFNYTGNATVGHDLLTSIDRVSSYEADGVTKKVFDTATLVYNTITDGTQSYATLTSIAGPDPDSPGAGEPAPVTSFTYETSKASSLLLRTSITLPDPDGNAANGLETTTSYAYDDRGNLIAEYRAKLSELTEELATFKLTKPARGAVFLLASKAPDPFGRMESPLSAEVALDLESYAVQELLNREINITRQMLSKLEYTSTQVQNPHTS